MHAQVSMLSMIFMAVSGTIALMLPLALIIFFRRRKGADLISAGIGAAVMILFAFVLESGVHKLVAQSGYAFSHEETVEQSVKCSHVWGWAWRN